MKEDTASATCIFSGKVLFRYHVIKDCGKKSNYEGNSKSMEGEGIIQICNQIAAIQKKIVKYIHDNDGATRNIINRFWPEAIELLDINHAQINISKRITAIASDLNPEISTLSDKIASQWAKITRRIAAKEFTQFESRW